MNIYTHISCFTLIYKILNNLVLNKIWKYINKWLIFSQKFEISKILYLQAMKKVLNYKEIYIIS